MTDIIVAVIAYAVGMVAGWYVKGKWGTKVQAVEDAVKK